MPKAKILNSAASSLTLGSRQKRRALRVTPPPPQGAWEALGSCTGGRTLWRVTDGPGQHHVPGFAGACSVLICPLCTNPSPLAAERRGKFAHCFKCTYLTGSARRDLGARRAGSDRHPGTSTASLLSSYPRHNCKQGPPLLASVLAL